MGALLVRSLSTDSGLGFLWFRTLGQHRRGLTDFVSPLSAIGNSLGFAGASATVALVIGGAAAVVAARSRNAGPGRALDAALMLPLGTSAVTLGFGLLIAFDTAPLDLRGNLVLVPLAHALVGIPFVVRALVPALRGLPPGLREAARTLGASRARTRLRVDLPLVRPAIVVGVHLCRRGFTW